MKAIVCTAYGSPEVLKLVEVAKPTPQPNEILVKVHATTVAAGDLRVRGFNSPPLLWLPMRLVLGLRKPRKPILGIELAGEVEAVGSQVSRFKPGDRIFALTGMNFGGHAEYVCLPEKGLVTHAPANVTAEEAAAVPVGATSALYFLRKAKVAPGQKVLIYGASGSVGTFAVQLAKHFGAEVTGVCSTANLDLVTSLGAVAVVDYTQGKLAPDGARYDVVFDAVGKLTKAHVAAVLAPGGTYVTVDGQGIAKVTLADMEELKELLEASVLKSVIDRRYTLEQVPEAHHYVETGRKKGNVVVTLVTP